MTDSLRDRLQNALATSYVLDSELVGGGMSRVFVATERALARKVVVKVLPPELAAGVNRERFQREIQLAAQLQHPHIVPLLSAGESGDLLWYTMPFIEGESLRAMMAQRGRLQVREVARILHDVVEALAYAHKRGVIHRDIKPGNILTLGQHALVTDFGVAKALSAALPISGQTSAGIAIGTPAYMAPEQLAADPSADHRMDLYAVGLLAYELLTGQSPFTGASPQATLAAQLTRVPEPLHEVSPDVPRELSTVIMRCLEKLPDDRPASADALLEMLEGVATPQGAILAGSPVSAARDSRKVRRRVAAGGLTVAVIAAALVVMTPSTDGTTPRVEAASDSASGATSARVVTDSASGTATVAGGTGSGSGTSGASATVGTPPPAAAPARTTPAPAPSAAPRALTRADSLAIAAAVHKGIEEEANARPMARTFVAVDSLVKERTRVADSITRAIIAQQRAGRFDMRQLEELARSSAKLHELRVHTERTPAIGAVPRTMVVPVQPVPPMPAVPDGRRRVVVADFRNATARKELDGIESRISDSLRLAVARTGAFDIVADEGTQNARVSVRSRNTRARSLGAGAVVSGITFVQRDSLVIQVQVSDLRRGYVFKVIESRPTSVEQPYRWVDDVIARTVAALGEVAWTASAPGAFPQVPPAL